MYDIKVHTFGPNEQTVLLSSEHLIPINFLPENILHCLGLLTMTTDEVPLMFMLINIYGFLPEAFEHQVDDK